MRVGFEWRNLATLYYIVLPACPTNAPREMGSEISLVSASKAFKKPVNIAVYVSNLLSRSLDDELP